MNERTSEPPDVWVFGTGYNYQGCDWVVLHQEDKPHTTLVVAHSDLNDEFLRAA